MRMRMRMRGREAAAPRGVGLRCLGYRCRVVCVRVCVPGPPGCARTDWSDGIGNEPHAWKFARTLMSRTVSSPFGRCRTCATHPHNQFIHQ